MLQRVHLPIFTPHLTDSYSGPEITYGDQPQPTNYVDSEKGRFIFLLDRSGSMQGAKIELAKEAITLFLRSLPPESEYQVVSFGSSIHYLHGEKRMLEYTKESLA